MAVSWDVIRTERQALADFLDTLQPAQWATPSLCEGWTVQDVAAHLAAAPAVTPGPLLADFARARFNPNRATRDSAVRWARRGPAQILDQLRKNAERDAKPPGVPRDAVLVDAVVHGLDVRRPLGDHRAIPAAAFVPTAEFCARTRWPGSMMLGGAGRKRIAGVRLVAEDQDWFHGEGPEVRGSGEALLLLLSGRRPEPDELHGDGVRRLGALAS
jgi:uncharacterized protein (TIGR03083 family)